jgi:hypothetical protein
VLDSLWSTDGARGAVVLLALAASLAGCSAPGRDAAPTAIARYDPATGRLERIEFDTTRNGRNDAVGIMDGTRVDRIEVDEDEDGIVDRWEFYDGRRRLEKAGFSRQGNGTMDAIAFYGPGGAVERIEMSTRGDGHFNRVEYYQFESLARVEEDTNVDGRIDKWETFAVDARATPDAPARPGSIVTAAFDDSFRGTPERRLVYRPDGSVLRVEVDPDGDGRFVEAAGPRER